MVRVVLVMPGVSVMLVRCWPVANNAPVAMTISPSTASGPMTQTMGSSP
jgi:hypothetical protein